MPHFLRYFMWGYQSHFRMFVGSSAEELFSSLDSSLHPRLFLVGFRQVDGDGGEPVCIEPEDDETLGYAVRLFAEVPRIVEEILAPEPGLVRLISDPLHERRVLERERRSAWSQAALQVLQRDEYGNGWRSFVSHAVPVEDYHATNLFQVLRYLSRRIRSGDPLNRPLNPIRGSVCSGIPSSVGTRYDSMSVTGLRRTEGGTAGERFPPSRVQVSDTIGP